ncbi:MAG TPA: hypothetical protein PKN33_07895 [Phycisphaerae bacterium]|nr:hypothetical protein [Phycisphaerae bacterium]
MAKTPTTTNFPETRPYMFSGTPTTIAFFKSKEQFLSKLRKHICNPEEPWERLLGRKFVRKLRQNLDGMAVCTLGDVYLKVVSVLDDGIQFASQAPLYIKYEEVSTSKTTRSSTSVLLLLAPKGYVMPAHNDIVRTAYFPSKDLNASWFTLFREAWKDIKQKLSFRERHDSASGARKQQINVAFYSEENWRSCPRTHNSGRRSRQRPWQDQIEDELI